MSSNKSIFYYQFFHQDNKEKLRKKTRKRYQRHSEKEKEKKSNTLVLNDKNIYQKMKNISTLGRAKILNNEKN